MAGSVAVGVYVASMDQYSENKYSPTLGRGSAMVDLQGQGERKAEAVESAMAQALPGAQARTVSGLRSYGDGARDVGYVSLTEVANPGCQGEATSAGQGVVEATAEGGIPSGPECTSRSSSAALGGVLVGDEVVLHALTGLSGERLRVAAAVLARGGAVVPASVWRDDGTTEVVVVAGGSSTARTGTCGCPPSPFPLRCCRPGCSRRRRLPAWACPCRRSPWSPPRSSPPRPGRRTGCATCCARWTSTERWWSSAVTSSGFGFGLLALLLGSAVIVLGASGIATGLAAADGRADLATLAAVGASPRTRRSLAGFQSAVTAVLGTVLGVIAGLVPAVAMVGAANAQARANGNPIGNAYPLVLPWTNLAVTLLVVPLLAAGAAVLLTRSRLPMVRRLA